MTKVLQISKASTFSAINSQIVQFI
uniref:Uncharacterized protein n=1 Tax=Anguilla anguilla TaxID=7936 RepID=A0A0E9TKL3_ANGAN